jgi:hypothetical protein
MKIIIHGRSRRWKKKKKYLVRCHQSIKTLQDVNNKYIIEVSLFQAWMRNLCVSFITFERVVSIHIKILRTEQYLHFNGLDTSIV